VVLYIDTSRPKWNFWTSHPGRDLSICRQNRAEAQTKDATIWVGEPLTTKSKKGWPQPIEQRIEKIWIVSGQPVQAARKEGHRKDKERYREVV
jgi:hypothetical protein